LNINQRRKQTDSANCNPRWHTGCYYWPHWILSFARSEQDRRDEE
jgi:hypothetical protein